MSEKIKKGSKIAIVFGLVLAVIVMYLGIPTSQAATIDEREMKISDSQISQTAVDYDFEGDHSTGTVKCLEVQFCDSSSGSCTTPTGMTTTSADKGDAGDWNTWTPASWTIDNATNGTIYYWNTTGEAGSGTDDSFEIGNITNSSVSGDYYARVQTWNPGSCSDRATCCATVATDDGVAGFYIISGVTVTASVPESLSMVIASVTAANCPEMGGTDRSDESGHAADTVPIGDLTAATFYFSCQSISVNTSAADGYTTTVFEDDQLTSGINQIVDGDCDATCSETSTGTWTSTAQDGFGYCCDDVTGNACLTTDASDDSGTGAVDWIAANQCDDATPEFKIFPEETVDSPDRESVMKSFSALSAADEIYIGYRVLVLGTQQSGDYENITVYIATPVY